MAFTRRFLSSFGLTDEQVTEIMNEHVGVTDELKQQRDGFKAEAEKVPGLNQRIAALEADEGYKKKYEDEHSAHEALKQKIADDAEAEKKKTAYRHMLDEAQFSHLDAIMRATDFSAIKLDKDGKLDNADELLEAAKKEWADFKITQTERGANVPNPPETGKASKTKEEIFKRDEHGRYLLSTEERQRAIAENLQSFQRKE